jgi:hypothetical protein
VLVIGLVKPEWRSTRVKAQGRSECGKIGDFHFTWCPPTRTTATDILIQMGALHVIEDDESRVNWVAVVERIAIKSGSYNDILQAAGLLHEHRGLLKKQVPQSFSKIVWMLQKRHEYFARTGVGKCYSPDDTLTQEYKL